MTIAADKSNLFGFPIFSDAERDRRWEAMRDLMRKNAVDAILVQTLTASADAEPVFEAQRTPVQRLQFFLSESVWDVETAPRGDIPAKKPKRKCSEGNRIVDFGVPLRACANRRVGYVSTGDTKTD
jgi:hypothetical protein